MGQCKVFHGLDENLFISLSYISLIIKRTSIEMYDYLLWQSKSFKFFQDEKYWFLVVKNARNQAIGSRIWDVEAFTLLALSKDY